MRKLICITVTLCFVFGAILPVGFVYAEATIKGIITNDITWTKADSPYSLQGPVAVDKGVTLTIEPGVTVNLNGYYIQVNGTLKARGTDNQKIYFNNGRVILTSESQQTGQSSVFENTVTDQLDVDTAVTITKNQFKTLNAGGSSIVRQNIIESLSASDSSTVINNDVTQACGVSGSASLESNNIDARVMPIGGSPKILNNKISDGIHLDWQGGNVTISGNEIHTKNTWARIFVAGSYAKITNNIIIGDSNNKPMGIAIGGIFASATITGNQIFDCEIGISVQDSDVTVSENLVVGCDVGLTFSLYEPLKGAVGAPWDIQSTVEIKSNTISRNTIGIQTSYYDGNATVTNNNIYENTEFNFKLLQSSQDVKALDNWWGSTDASVIQKKIYDRQFDFNLGSVLIDPFLLSSAVGTPAIPVSIPSVTFQPTAPATPTPTQPQNGVTNPPTLTPSQPSIGTDSNFNIVEIAILAVLAVIAVLLFLLILTLKQRNKKL
jgi:parallel beta-helix repeat protein